MIVCLCHGGEEWLLFVTLGETCNFLFLVSFSILHEEVKLTLFAACAMRKEHGCLVAAASRLGRGGRDDVGPRVCSCSSHSRLLLPGGNMFDLTRYLEHES